MPDGPFKAMGREKRPLAWLTQDVARARIDAALVCENCGGWIFEGDWPWCSNSDPTTHRR